jgi:hypothetical protein
LACLASRELALVLEPAAEACAAPDEAEAEAEAETEAECEGETPGLDGEDEEEAAAGEEGDEGKEGKEGESSGAAGGLPEWMFWLLLGSVSADTPTPTIIGEGFRDNVGSVSDSAPASSEADAATAAG